MKRKLISKNVDEIWWNSSSAKTVFAVGADNVQVHDFEEQVFAWVRASAEIPGDNAEAFVDHIKDIPRQLLAIIQEDPTVLDSCANFSVALVGPP